MRNSVQIYECLEIDFLDSDWIEGSSIMKKKVYKRVSKMSRIDWVFHLRERVQLIRAERYKLNALW